MIDMPDIADTAAEAGALACILSADGDAGTMLNQLQESDFSDLRHIAIYRALTSVQWDTDRSIDTVELFKRLSDRGELEDAGGKSYILNLPDATPSPANFPAWLDTIRDRAERRRMLAQARDLQAQARNLARPVAPSQKPQKPSVWVDLVEDGAEMQTREIPAIIQIAEGIVASASKLSIVSSAKCFKTWFTIHMALSISHGMAFLGRYTTRSRILYVNLELKPQTFTRRLQAISKALEITIDAKWFSHLSLRGKLSGLSVHEIVTRIIGVAKSLSASVVVIDPLFKLNVEGEENSSRDQTVFCNELDRLTTEGPFTTIFNDHSSKGNQSEKEPLDVIRGSSAKGGDLDACLVLRRHEVDGCFRVDLVHRELAPVEPFVIGWEYPLMRLRDDLSPEAMKKPKGGRQATHTDQELLQHIAGRLDGNPISITEWAKAAGINRTTLNLYTPAMRTKDLIRTVGEGTSARQCITEKGLKFITEKT